MGLDQWVFRREIENGAGEDSAIYWRKCNQIHGYMDNLFGGVENCGDYPITIDELKDLRKTCQEVLDNNDLAEELLPVTMGCFFGSYEYDECYFYDLKYTIEKIDKLLENHKDGMEYYYHAWW